MSRSLVYVLTINFVVLGNENKVGDFLLFKRIVFFMYLRYEINNVFPSHELKKKSPILG